MSACARRFCGLASVSTKRFLKDSILVFLPPQGMPTTEPAFIERNYKLQLVVTRCLALPGVAGMQTGGSTVAFLGALGPAVCSPTSPLSGVVPGTAGSASVRVTSLSALS